MSVKKEHVLPSTHLQPLPYHGKGWAEGLFLLLTLLVHPIPWHVEAKGGRSDQGKGAVLSNAF